MESPNVRKAVGYRRVSSRSQADNFSLRSQDRDIRNYCEQEAILFVLMFTDVGSGLSAKHRHELHQLFAYVLDPANGITDVVFWDLDRFTRNIEEFFLYTKELINKGITLHLAVDGEKYEYNSDERWHGRIIAAQAESKRISRRTKKGQREATKLGHHIGKPPWGYRLVHDSDDPNEEGETSDDLNEKGKRIVCGRLEPDPEKWDDCLKFWELASKDWTPMRITRYINQHNIKAPNGGEWTDGAARYIMKNRVYHGRGLPRSQSSVQVARAKGQSSAGHRGRQPPGGGLHRGVRENQRGDPQEAQKPGSNTLPLQPQPAEQHPQVRPMPG